MVNSNRINLLAKEKTRKIVSLALNKPERFTSLNQTI